MACLGFLLKAFHPKLGKKKRVSFPVERRVSGKAQSVKKKATVRIGLPPKPDDTKQTIRIQLPTANKIVEIKGSGESKARDLGKDSPPRKRKAVIRISLPPKPSETIIESKGMKAMPPGSMPIPMVPFATFHTPRLREGNYEEEFLGSSRIVIGPIIGRSYWLAGMNVMAVFEGFNTIASHYCFNCGGHSFYLDKASRCIRLATDRKTQIATVPVAVSSLGEMGYTFQQSTMESTTGLGSQVVVQRMRVLTYMYEELLISNEEYAKKKSAILDEI